MSIESRVENFFRGLVSQIPPPHKRSKSTVNEQSNADDEEDKPTGTDENGHTERGRRGSMRKVKARSASKNQQRRLVPVAQPLPAKTSPTLEHVDDFPVSLFYT